MASLPDLTGDLEGTAKDIFDDIVKRRASHGTRPRGLYVPLMNHPELAQLVERLGYYLKFEGKLPRDAYQFIVLSVAKRTRVAFAWIDHEAPARAAGLKDSIIDAILKDDRASIPHPFSLILETIDAVLEFRSVPKQLQDEIIRIFEVQGLIEIVTLCGFYQMVGEITQAFDVPPPEGSVSPF